MERFGRGESVMEVVVVEAAYLCDDLGALELSG